MKTATLDERPGTKSTPHAMQTPAALHSQTATQDGEDGPRAMATLIDTESLAGPDRTTVRNPVPEQSAKAGESGILPGSDTYRRVSFALFLAGFSTFSLLYCVQPLLPAFTEEFHIGAAQSSLALSLSTGFLAFSILVGGVLSERLGRKSLMFASMALAAVFNMLAGLAPDWHLLLAARALEGMALGGVPAIAMAYLAEEIAPQGLGLAMGLYVGGTAFGGMMGRVGMSFLTEFFSWRVALLAVGALDLAMAIAFVLMLPPSRNFVRKLHLTMGDHLRLWRRHLQHRSLPLLFAVGCLSLGVFVTIYNYAAFRLMSAPFSLSAGATGLVFSAYIFGVVASSWAGALADRFGRGPLMTAGVLISIAGLLLSASSALDVVITGIVLMTIGFFTAHAVASGWVGRMAVGAKGHASALYLLAYYLGSSLIGSVGGWFWQHGGWQAVAAFSLVLLLVCLGCAGLLWRRVRTATLA
ncbi:MFS transporter [Herbaspirillum lusitanum]|uniref:MFS transporter n=2 Tax=Herbaspirillum lusitanum TaxID=213312 RepID=A0ABW9A5V3_9BURK